MYSVFAFVFGIFRKIHIFGIVLYINFLKHSYDLTELRTDITLNRRSLACFNTHSYEVFIIMTIFGDLFFIYFLFFLNALYVFLFLVSFISSTNLGTQLLL